MTATELRLKPLRGVPRIEAGADLARVALAALEASHERLEDGDVLVFAQKIVSKAESRTVDLATVHPSAHAVELSQKTGKDARLVELILRESTEIVRLRENLLIVAHRLGITLANAGIDQSNVDGRDKALLLPEDPDRSAAQIRRHIEQATGRRLAVLIIDSIGRAWRQGTIGTAIGVSGMPGLVDLRGTPDLFGRPLTATDVGIADELASAASLVMGQAGEGLPIVLARGVPYVGKDGSARDLVRPKESDLFR